jgi:hypothetical protein
MKLPDIVNKALLAISFLLRNASMISGSIFYFPVGRIPLYGAHSKFNKRKFELSNRVMD